MAALQLLTFLNLVLININGAYNNQGQLRDAIDSLSTKPDIIGLTETKLKLNETIHVPGYTCWHAPDAKGIAGTVYLIHDRLMPVCTSITPPESDEHTSTGHTQWIRILSSNRPLYMSLSYISPNDPENYTLTINKLIHDATELSKSGDCIHMGDFNNTGAGNGTKFNRFLKALGLTHQYVQHRMH